MLELIYTFAAVFFIQNMLRINEKKNIYLCKNNFLPWKQIA